MNIKEPPITQRQSEIIIATVLGGSSIMKSAKGKNSYLSMRTKNRFWLEYKAMELKEFASPKPFTIEKTFRWHSLCYPVFNTFREMFYPNGKRILSPTLMEKLRLHDLGFAFWYGDCGTLHNGSITLRTHIWGKKGTGLIADYFADCGYPGAITRVRDYYRFVMNKEVSVKFLALVTPHLPTFLV